MKKLKPFYSLFAPTIVAEPSWGIPEVLKQHIQMERMKHIDDIFEQEMATEWEALIYIENITHIAPLGEEWANIYFKLFKRLLRDVAGIDTNIDFLTDVNEELTSDEERELITLRKRIFQKQISALKEKLKEVSK